MAYCLYIAGDRPLNFAFIRLILRWRGFSFGIADTAVFLNSDAVAFAWQLF